MKIIKYFEYLDILTLAMKNNSKVKMNCDIPENNFDTIYLKSEQGVSYVNTKSGLIGGLCRFKKGNENLSELHQKYCIGLGGNNLNCYDVGLVELYEKQGFEVVNRTPFNPEFAPKNWESDKFLSQRPDYIIMKLKVN